MMSLHNRQPFRFIAIFLSIVLGSVLLSPSTPIRALESQQPDPRDYITELSLTQEVQKTVLSNGLTVLTKEVHTAPVVSVQVWYMVGSRNEPVGQNGISHQLEHLMFKGTRDRPIQFGRLLSALGSQSNAFTSYDQTAYFGTVQRDRLDALLTLEADRMVNTQLNETYLASEKRVVISELQGYENNPSYRLDRAVMQAAFPEHPYGLPVGGTRADVERFTLEQVKTYYQQYYRPDHAILVVTGDFATEPTLQRIRDLYESISVPGREPVPQDSPQPLEAMINRPTTTDPLVLREPGSASLIEVVYPLPNQVHPDVPAIDVMNLILTQGRSSRLYQALVESGLASSVDGSPAEMLEPGWYSISVTAPAEQSLAEVNRVLKDTLDAFCQQVVMPEELDRAKKQLQALFILNNQDITSQAMQLAYDQMIAGDYRFSDRYLAAIDRLTPADIQRVAQLYLDPARAMTGFFEPTQIDAAESAASNPNSLPVENFNAGSPVDPAEVARYLPAITPSAATTPQPLPQTLTLPNGLQVLLLADHSTPTVNLSGWVNAGTQFDQEGKAGIADLTATNLMNGTQQHTALQLAEALEDRGARLDVDAAREGVMIAGTALSTDLPVLVETLAEVMQEATFPADQLNLSRQQALTALQSDLDDPSQLGWRIFRQTVYPANHPFHPFPTEASLNAITQADLVAFYQRYYRPDTTILALVGDFDPEAVQALLQQSFGTWKASGQPPVAQFPPVPLPQTRTHLRSVIPGKAESVTVMGYNGISRRDPRFYAALVMNQILGGDTLASRLGTEIRDRLGLTYGIYSYFIAGRHPGPFSITLQTSPEDADQAIASILALLQQLRDQGVTPAELEAAKRSLTTAYPVDLASPDYLVSAVLMNAVYGLPRNELQQFPAKIEAVSAAQVQQGIQDLIHPSNLVIVTAGPGPVAAGR